MTNLSKTDLNWIKSNFTKKLSGEDVLDGSQGEVATDFGQIDFKGATRRARAKFIRLKTSDSPEKTFELMTRVWQLEKPRLLISVTGGAKSFNMDPKLKQHFARGLLKVAQTPGAWVITGGTNTGVMKHVGEALQGASKACIGIATWGIVSKREKLIGSNLNPVGGKFSYNVASSLVEKGAFLDHNHTHFLLADDGSSGKYGVEISVRSEFEKYIMNSVQEQVPTVYLLLEGGPKSLETVCEAVAKEPVVPVVIIKDSGRAADVLADVIDRISEDDLERIRDEENMDQNLLDVILKNFKEFVIDEEKDNEEKQKQKKNNLKTAYFNVLKCLEKKEHITVFQMGAEANVDEAILIALLSSKKTSPASQLRLTLLWDRANLAEEKILSQSIEWKEKELNDIMIMALAMGRVDFVKLFLQKGISIKEILTNSCLEFLYGYRSHMKTSTLMYKDESNVYKQSKVDEKIVKLLCSYEGIDVSKAALQMEHVQKIINKLLTNFIQQKDEKFIENLSSNKTLSGSMPLTDAHQTFEYPFRELFFWAVLNNMQDMAMYLWGFEEDGMAKALIAGEIYNALADQAEMHDMPDNITNALRQNALDFNSYSFKLLDECYRTDTTKTEQLLTCRCSQFPQQTCLKLAIASNHKEYVSHSAVQVLLNDVWTAAIKQKDITSAQVLTAMFFPPYICYKFDFRNSAELKKMVKAEDADSDGKDETTDKKNLEDESSTSESQTHLVGTKQPNYSSINEETRMEKSQELPWYQKLIEFYFKTPMTKFYANVIAYFVFLGLFAYVAISKKNSKMEIPEYILIIFVVNLLVEEINQFINSESPTLSSKFKEWSSNKWNLMDFVAIVLFFVALGLRLHSSTADIGHLLYALDAGLWILRLLDVFYAHRILGPYVVMIYKMFIDMMYFLVILFVFLLAYGVATKAILQPQAAGWHMLRDIFFHPYYNIYGELFIDRDPENNSTTRFGTPTINSYAEPIAWTLLGAYLLIANVLLLNLLIAIFNNTFTEVEENSSQIWKFERYHLIIEYANRPALVPPFMLLCHIYMFFDWLFSKCCRSDATSKSKNLQLSASDEELEELVEFEIECMANFQRAQAKTSSESLE
ncbi:transient receptor potential cation channel subfamily M member 3-like isoform X1 [Hydractinia symbiolongicarpus]|uniref:transient receptor potential cation channel subfamily M member 3-like isoform X1 n=1 Tax=Hydractinia symbiolongicarpus TaxID=13093 RepID=UPI00254BA3F6|nr:transient receptor potential cation channel subfamily M member 3-like isoform X1 [Hydractinia symbiolongicarpus]